MLTIKKRMQPMEVLIGVVGVIILSACAPPGQNALSKGEQLLRTGKYNDAITTFQQATELLANEQPAMLANTWNSLALAYHYSGQNAKAEQAYRQALKLDRDLAEARYNLGSLLLEQGNLAHAADELNTFIQLRPKETSGFVKLGEVYLRAADLNTGTERDRQLDYAQTTFENALRVGSSASALNALGMIHIHRNHNVSDALAKFNEALQTQTNFPPALLNIAIVYHQYVNDRRQALIKYREYLACQPRPSNWQQVEAVTQALQQEMAPRRTSTNAPPAIQRATPKQPSHAVSEDNSSPAIANSSRAAPAVSKKETRESKLVSRSANLPDAPHAETRKTVPQPAPDPKTNTPTTIASTPPTPDLRQKPANQVNLQEAERLLSEGVSLENGNRPGEAIKKYREAIKAAPRAYDAHARLGICAQETGDFATSVQALEQALAIRPDSANTRYALAWSLHKIGDTKRAVKELEAVLAQNPTEIRAHLLAGNLYSQQLKDQASARKHYLKVLEINPKHPQASAVKYWLAANPS